MYELETTSYFRKKYRKLTSKNSELITRVEKTLNQLAKNPKHKNLKSHKIMSAEYGEVISSSVTGDIRILWKKIDEKLILLLLDIGGHSGGSRVYR
jgi:mRNA-degrading endonuclease YafQ of YafQ-DinJ toxin-antitoxin module